MKQWSNFHNQTNSKCVPISVDVNSMQSHMNRQIKQRNKPNRKSDNNHNNNYNMKYSDYFVNYLSYLSYTSNKMFQNKQIQRSNVSCLIATALKFSHFDDNE